MKERFSARGYIVERATAALSRMFKRQIAGGMKRATHPSAILRWDAGWCFQWNQKLSEVSPSPGFRSLGRPHGIDESPRWEQNIGAGVTARRIWVNLLPRCGPTTRRKERRFTSTSGLHLPRTTKASVTCATNSKLDLKRSRQMLG